MFHDCNLLIKFPLLRENKKELTIKNNSVKQNISISLESSNKEEEFYSSSILSDYKKESLTQINSSSNSLILFEGYSLMPLSPDKSKWNSCIYINTSNMFKGNL